MNPDELGKSRKNRVYLPLDDSRLRSDDIQTDVPAERVGRTNKYRFGDPFCICGHLFLDQKGVSAVQDRVDRHERGK